MSWGHLGDETPKARKAYRCFLCLGEISVGEKHVKRSGVTEDGLYSFRMHSLCESLTKGWDQESWDCHEPSEFRDNELAEAKAREVAH